MLSQLRENSIRKTEEYLKTLDGFEEFALDENKSDENIRGWKVEISVNEKAEKIVVLIDKYFPLSLPSISLADRTNWQRKPHIIRGGKLCLTDENDLFNPYSGHEVVKHLIEKAKTLLSEISEDGSETDYIDEFESYWSTFSDNKLATFYSLLDPNPPSRIVKHMRIDDDVYFAETEEQLQEWFKNKGEKYRSSSLRNTVFLWLTKPLIPENFPKTNQDFKNALDSESNSQMLQTVLPQDLYDLPVIFAFATSDSSAIGGVTLREQYESKLRNGKEIRISTKKDGFRKNSDLPLNILEQRYLNSAKASCSRVQRIDARWIHERGGTNSSRYLREKHACLIGCGYLGGAVALNLAKAGVGRFTLIDNDTLTWNNIARHALGADSVGQRKADAMRKFLISQLPHLKVSSFGGAWWLDVLEKDASQLLDADVIVATTGSWGVDSSLNSFMKLGINNIPIVFGWIEPFSCAGQALAVLNNGGCLQCGMTAVGKFSRQATNWNELTLKRSGACGEFFQPYGLTDAIPIQHMITKMVTHVLHRNITRSTLHTWVGRDQDLKSCGGVWSEDIQTNFLGVESTLLERDWPVIAECIICNG
jgi:hypothetical protein